MGLGRKSIGTIGVLIGMYLLAANASGWGKLMAEAGKAGNGAIKTLQGR